MNSRVKHYAKLAPVGVLRYSGFYVIRPESVPDHVSALTSLAIMIYKDLKKMDISIDLKLLIYKIAIHDMSESLTSDIVRPLKYHHPELTNEFRVAEKDLLSRSGIPDEIIEDINNAKDETLEGKILKLLDILQCVVKLSEESQDLNNRLMEEELTKCTKLYLERISIFSDNDVLYNYFKSLI